MALKTKHSQDFDLYEDVEKIKAALLDTAYDVKGKAGAILNDSVEGVKERSELMKERVVDYTEKKPFQSLGIAFIVGAAIGYLIHK